MRVELGCPQTMSYTVPLNHRSQKTYKNYNLKGKMWLRNNPLPDLSTDRICIHTIL